MRSELGTRLVCGVSQDLRFHHSLFSWRGGDNIETCWILSGAFSDYIGKQPMRFEIKNNVRFLTI